MHLQPDVHGADADELLHDRRTLLGADWLRRGRDRHVIRGMVRGAVTKLCHYLLGRHTWGRVSSRARFPAPPPVLSKRDVAVTGS